MLLKKFWTRKTYCTVYIVRNGKYTVHAVRTNIYKFLQKSGDNTQR